MVDGAEGWGAEEGVDGEGLRGWGGVGREGARTRQPTFSLFSLDAFYVLPPFSLSRIQLFDNTETHDFGTMKSKSGVNSLGDAKRSETSQGRSHKGTNPLAKWSSRSKAKKEETEEEDSDDEDEPSLESESDDEPRS